MPKKTVQKTNMKKRAAEAGRKKNAKKPAAETPPRATEVRGGLIRKRILRDALREVGVLFCFGCNDFDKLGNSTPGRVNNKRICF